MVASFSLILLCQLAGEIVVRGLALPMPGPVIGLLFLLILLLLRDRLRWIAIGPLGNQGVEEASRNLLGHLSLLFVPAGVGIVENLDLLAERGVAMIAILAASVLITLLVTVATFLITSRIMTHGWRGRSPKS